MQVEYINPFIAALHNAFLTMLQCDLQRGELYLKQDKNPQYEVSGIIGLSGKAVGTVVLSLSKNVALQAASAMLLCEMTEIDAEVIDATGELTNMVAGSAKAELEQYQLSVSLPNVVTGRGYEIHFPSQVTPISVPFESVWGPLSLEVGLAEVPQAAEV